MHNLIKLKGYTRFNDIWYDFYICIYDVINRFVQSLYMYIPICRINSLMLRTDRQQTFGAYTDLLCMKSPSKGKLDIFEMLHVHTVLLLHDRNKNTQKIYRHHYLDRLTSFVGDFQLSTSSAEAHIHHISDSDLPETHGLGQRVSRVSLTPRSKLLRIWCHFLGVFRIIVGELFDFNYRCIGLNMWLKRECYILLGTCLIDTSWQLG